MYTIEVTDAQLERLKARGVVTEYDVTHSGNVNVVEVSGRHVSEVEDIVNERDFGEQVVEDIQSEDGDRH